MPRTTPNGHVPVFIGRGPTARALRQVLVDYASLHLIDPFIWVDAEAFAGDTSAVSVVVPQEDGPATVDSKELDAAIVELGLEKVSLVALQVLDDGSASIEEEARTLLDALNRTLSAEVYGQFSVMVTATGATPQGPAPLLDGFSNCLLAPEDSVEPNKPIKSYTVDGSRPEFILLAASNLAGMCGLWSGITGLPLEKLQGIPNGSFRLVRSYYRLRDGMAAQDQIKERLFDTSTTPVPTPNDDTRSWAKIAHAGNPVRFQEEAAQQVFENINRVLDPGVVSTQTEQIQEVDVSVAMKDFFRAWGSSFFSLPGNFFREVSGGAREWVGDTLQTSMYGEVGSRFQVNRNEAYLQGSQIQMVPQEKREDSARQLGPSWDLYKNIVMSLLDAEKRRVRIDAHESEVEFPRAVNTGGSDYLQVAKHPADIIPGPSEDFLRKTPSLFTQQRQRTPVLPYDRTALKSFQDELRGTAQGHPEHARIDREFREWRKRHQSSVAVRVSEMIAAKGSALWNRDKELDAQLRSLQARNEEHTYSTLGVAMRWLGWVTSLSLVFFLILLGVLSSQEEIDNDFLRAFYVNFSSAETKTKVIFFTGWVLSWLFFAVIQALSEALDFKRSQSRRHHLISQLDKLLKEKERVTLALQRTAVASEQFVSVSAVLGALVERPFGTVTMSQGDSIRPGNQMPRSLSFQSITQSDVEEKYPGLVDTLSTYLYRQGWLSDYMDIGFDDLARSAGVTAVPAPRQLFEQLGGTYGTTLGAFASAAGSEEFLGRDRHSEVWADKVARGMRDKKYAKSQRETLRSLIAEGEFHNAIATAEGAVDGILHVDRDWCFYSYETEDNDSLGSRELLVQVGRNAHLEDLSIEMKEVEHTPRYSAYSSLPGADFGTIGAQQPSERRPAQHQKPSSGLHLPGEGL